MNLPGHYSSFNPSPEYAQEGLEAQKNLRNLESSDQLIKDNFERLMSLYLAPRVQKQKIQMKSEDLLQKLPDLEELAPFPSRCIYECKAETSLIQNIQFTEDDNYFAVLD